MEETDGDREPTTALCRNGIDLMSLGTLRMPAANVELNEAVVFIRADVGVLTMSTPDGVDVGEARGASVRLAEPDVPNVSAAAICRASSMSTLFAQTRSSSRDRI